MSLVPTQCRDSTKQGLNRCKNLHEQITDYQKREPLGLKNQFLQCTEVRPRKESCPPTWNTSKSRESPTGLSGAELNHHFLAGCPRAKSFTSLTSVYTTVTAAAMGTAGGVPRAVSLQSSTVSRQETRGDNRPKPLKTRRHEAHF